VAIDVSDPEGQGCV